MLEMRPDTVMSAGDASAPPGTAGTMRSAPSVVAGEMAEDMTLAMFDGFLSSSMTELPSGDFAVDMKLNDAEILSLRAQCEQIQAELASARTEIEFAGLKEAELENRYRLAEETIEGLRKQNDVLIKQMQRQAADLTDRFTSENEKVALAHKELAAARAEAASASKELERIAQRERVLENQNADARLQLSRMERELADARAMAQQQQEQFVQLQQLQTRAEEETVERPPDRVEAHNEDTPLLTAAYQQISVLNTQLAHLYTELTHARTEANVLRGGEVGDPVAAQSNEQGDGVASGGVGTASQATTDMQKQHQQIADLVSDIRHLQLDLEYHQQKLDQMIEERHGMVKDLKQSQKEVAESRQQLDERDQLLRHREVDIEHLQQELRAAGKATGDGGGATDETVLATLRAEAAAKDSALIVSHYELHKEKLMRDRLEQKNIKLMGRMQKLMMVVETMRKESVSLERALGDKERACEEKEQQLRHVTIKARQLQKVSKAPKVGTGVGPKTAGGKNTTLELDMCALPPLKQQPVDTDGRRSGASTPRSARGAPASPYKSR